MAAEVGHLPQQHIEASTVGVEIPDSFRNAIMNPRKGTNNQYIHTFLTQWTIMVTISIEYELSGDSYLL